MDVSIIIVNYNTGSLLRDCVQSVKDKTAGVVYEIIIVDNASSDGSVELMQARHPEVKVLRCRENNGYGKGNNLGMREATGNYFFLLNPDTLLVNNAVKSLFEFLERNENAMIAVCGAALYNAGGEPTISYGLFPTPCSMIFYSLPLTFLFRGYEGRVKNRLKEPFVVDFVTGADFFVRRNVLEQVGSFDENYFAYYEETDLSMRIAKHGYRSMVEPSAAIVHLEGKSFSSSIRRKKMMLESSLYYLRKFGGQSALIKLYCFMLEMKCRIYRIFSAPGDAAIWSDCISAAKSYRRRK